MGGRLAPIDETRQTMIALFGPKGLDRRQRLLHVVVAATTLWLLAVGVWEIASPFGAGHIAVVPARGIIADNMLKWGIWYPVRDYTVGAPEPALAYAHHPWGSYYLFVLAEVLFGRHEWALRLVPVLVNAAMPWLLATVARELWGTTAAVFAALGCAVCPIILAFLQFPSFEQFWVASCLLASIGVLKYLRWRRWRWAGVTLIGVLACAHSDWPGYIFVAVNLGVGAVLIAFWPKIYLDRRQLRNLLRLMILCGAILGGSLLLYISLFRRAGLLEDWLGSAQFRATGNEASLVSVLRHRRYWIELMFTPVGIGVGLVGAAIMLARMVRYRRWTETLPLVLLGSAIVHYLVFKNGADVHIYWPLPFAAQFCLSLGLLAATLEASWPAIGARWSWLSRRRWWRGLPVSAVPLIVFGILFDGLRVLDYARDTGCRFNEHGRLIRADFDKTTALEAFARRIPEQSTVGLHTSMFADWAQQWALHRPVTIQGVSSSRAWSDEKYAMLDTRFTSSSTLAAAGALDSITAIGPFWLLDQGRERQPLDAFRLVQHVPSVLEHYLVSSHDAPYTVAVDPFRTWELRWHLNQTPNPWPPPPTTYEERRAFHNAAVARGDQAEADRMRLALVQQLDRSSARQFADGTRLLGHRLVGKWPRRLQVYFQARGPVFGGARFEVRSRVLRAPMFSSVAADDTVRSVGFNFEIPPSDWRANMIYVSVSDIRKRPGLEVFSGRWIGGAAHQLPHSETTSSWIRLLELR